MRHRGQAVRVMCAAALASAAMLAAPAPAPADSGTTTVSVGSTPIGAGMPRGFVSFSFEFRALRQYAGGDAAHLNPVLIALLRNLAPHGGAVLRVGGHSTDQTWWPVRGQIPPTGINYALTPGWMRVARALAQTTGYRLLPGINLAANRPALAAAEARALVAGIGTGNLSGLEIGNEPDAYGSYAWAHDGRGHVITPRHRGYSLHSLIGEYSRWRALLPRVPLAGPAWATLGWGSGLGLFLASEPRLAAVTLHRYPLRACVTDPSLPNFPSIPNLLAARSSQGLAQAVAPFVPVAHRRGAPLRLDELNSASCTGRRGVSDTFAAALWLVDTLFNLEAVGVDGVNLHTLPNAAYQPFSFSHDRAGWRGMVAPAYYGALFFARAFPRGARLLPVSGGGETLPAWATVDPAGVVRTTLINKSALPATVQLQLPGVMNAPLTTQLLSAPAIDATGGVTLGGQSFGPSTRTGTLVGSPAGTWVSAGLLGYTVTVPAYSALLLSR